MLIAQREVGALELTVETGVDVLDEVDGPVEDELTLVEDVDDDVDLVDERLVEVDELAVMVSDELEAGVDEEVEVAPIDVGVEVGMLSEDREVSAMVVVMRGDDDDEVKDEEVGDEEEEEEERVDEEAEGACPDVDVDAVVDAVSVEDRPEVDVAVELTLTDAGLACRPAK